MEMEARATDAPEAPAEAVPRMTEIGGVSVESAGRCQRKQKVGAEESGTLLSRLVWPT